MGAASIRSILGLVIFVLWLLVVARVAVSWVDPRGRHPASRTIIAWTEPFLAPIRRVIPPVGGLDLSPLIIAVILGFALRAVGV